MTSLSMQELVAASIAHANQNPPISMATMANLSCTAQSKRADPIAKKYACDIRWCNEQIASLKQPLPNTVLAQMNHTSIANLAFMTLHAPNTMLRDKFDIARCQACAFFNQKAINTESQEEKKAPTEWKIQKNKKKTRNQRRRAHMTQKQDAKE
jgi:hypothetical protein